MLLEMECRGGFRGVSGVYGNSFWVGLLTVTELFSQPLY